MNYEYDLYGWYCGECAADVPRSTDIAPPSLSLSTAPGEMRANWAGLVWVMREYAAPPPADMSAAARQHWEAIKQERDRRATTGGYQVAGSWYHSDVFSRTQQMGLLLLGAGIPAGLQWKTMDGSFVTMTQSLAGQVFAAAAASDAALFARAEQIKAGMETDPAGFDLAGQVWPPVFGG